MSPPLYRVIWDQPTQQTMSVQYEKFQQLNLY